MPERLTAPYKQVPTEPARDARLDNAKALLITLVVFAHFMSPIVAGNFPDRWGYYLILSFHMPAFIFVSGWLSRSELFTRRGLASLAWTAWAFVALTLVNNIVWVVIQDVRFDPVKWLKDPYFALWYLQALIWWKILIALFGLGTSRKAAFISIAAALAVAAASGYAPVKGSLYSFSRTFAFLPFFVAGFRFKQQGWRIPSSRTARVIAVFVLAAVYVALFNGLLVQSAEPLFARRLYAGLGGFYASWYGRLVLFAVVSAAVAAFLTLVPRRSLPITALGATVISVYGWHALILRLIRHYHLGALLSTWPRVALMTAVVMFVFGYGPIARATTLVLTGKRPPNGRSSRHSTTPR